MSYSSRAALSADPGFRSRVTTCCVEQALVFTDDGRPDIAALADAIVLSHANAGPLVDLVAVSPNFVDVEDPATVTDPDILAAVQATWPTYAAIAYPAPEVAPAADPGGGED
jgi:hypothetical protein